jgi:hypothetical protein
MATTLIRGATLIDGRGGAPVADAAVLITDDRIEAAGPRAQVEQHPSAASAEIVEAAGRWIIPGLIDAHIHATLTGLESMRVFLACGVTTVRDIGGPLDVVVGIRDSLAAGDLPGPRFIFAGPLIDGEVPSFPNSILPIIESTADAQVAADLADECVARGAGSIKLYFRLPRESVGAVVKRIAGRVPVTGHLGRTWASQAVAEGINGFEHAIITLYNDLAPDGRGFDAMTSSMASGDFWTDLLAGWADVDAGSRASQTLLESMLARDVTLDPTLDITRGGLGTPLPQEPNPNFKYVRKELATVWEAGRAAQRNAPPPPAERREIAARGHAVCDDVVRRYHEMGGRVLAGTDVGAVPMLVPGFSLHGEIGMLVGAGLSTSAALKAATIDAATALRIEKETGSIEAGKIADIVVLEADPLADIANLGRVRTVFRAGVAHDAATLLAEAAAG